MPSSLAVVTIKSVFLCLFFIVNIIGNSLLCYSIYSKKKLQTLTNYLVFNLAAADLLFAVTTMPTIISTTIAGRWVLGGAICQISGVFNLLLSLASIWTLIVISINRYFAVGRATAYKRIFTQHRILFLIACVWCFSSVIALMPQFGWGVILPGDNLCLIDGKRGQSYALFMILMAYIIPFPIIGGLYTMIYLSLKKHKETMKNAVSVSSLDSFANQIPTIKRTLPSSVQNGQECTVDPNTNGVKPDDKLNPKCAIIHRSLLEIQCEYTSDIPSDSNIGGGVVGNRSSTIEQTVDTSVTGGASIKTDGIELSASTTSVVSLSTVKLVPSAGMRRLAREARVTRMLFVVVVAFFICWTPISVGSILYGLNVRSDSFEIIGFGVVMACLSSTCNPVIISYMSTSFRKAFRESLDSVKKKVYCSPSKSN